MKLFQPLVRQFKETRWRYVSRSLNQPIKILRQAIQSSEHWQKVSTVPLNQARERSHRQIPSVPAQLPLTAPTGTSPNPPIQPPKAPLPNQPGLKRKAPRSPLLLAVAVISVTSALGYRFYQAPKLDIGKAAPQTIYAPGSVEIEDQKATEENRKTARKGSSSVLMLDQSATQKIQKLIHQQLQQGMDIRQQVGAFPFTGTNALTLRTQSYLRQLSEGDWQTLLITVDPALVQTMPGLKPEQINSANPGITASAGWKQSIQELRNYRRSVDLGAYLTLIHEITEARFKYTSAVGGLPQPLSPTLNSSFILAILDLSDGDWQQLRTQVPKIGDRILAQGIAPGLPESVLTDAIKLNLRDALPSSTQAIAFQLLSTFLQTNLIHDEEQTRLLAEQAAQGIKPVLVTIRQGEPIVYSGETITSADFTLLDHFGLSRREVDWAGLIGFGLMVSGAVTLIWFVKQRFQIRLRRRDGVLLWLFSLSTPLLIVLHVPAPNLPATGLLLSGFYGTPMGLTVTGLMTVLLGVGMEMPWSQLLSSAAAGLMCSWLGGRLRSREEIALLGVGVGIVQGTLYLLCNVASGISWYTLLGSSAIQGLLGLAWVIAALGISPYLEQVFDLVTTIRLVELANPNRPLLKRLCSTAPGTFQHTLFVATLAEAAARALGCNVELIRAGTLYHDIGKMHDPQGFIENQMGGPNKHDLINDPWISAAIIKKHVTEGLVMARKARLPKAVQAFIPEHQGAMLIAYFYHQAQQRIEQTLNPDGTPATLNEEDFRYDGPIPQSRETGIVMLADSCEAALRSLKDATPEEALSMINKILRARWQDNQLTDSGLTRDEMTQIASIFVQVWQQFNHQRIAYPKLTPIPPAPLKGA